MCYVTRAGLQARYGTARHGAVLLTNSAREEIFTKSLYHFPSNVGRQWPPWTQQRVIFELQFVLPPPLPLPCHLVISIITLIGETLLAWAGLGWAGEECDVINIAHCTALPLLTTSHLTQIPDIQWKDRFKRDLFIRILKLFNMTDGRKFEFNHCWH